jgi:hypothetical protein
MNPTRKKKFLFS